MRYTNLNHDNKAEPKGSTSLSEHERFAERLVFALKGESVRSFARRSELSETALRKYISGESTPNVERLVAIAQAANVSLEWLATGGGAVEQGNGVEVDGVIDERFALVPLYDVEVSAGHGVNVDQENVLSQIAFRQDWLKENGLNIKSLVSLSARGDSMEPTIRDGDLLLVDTKQKEVVEDGIYVLRIESHLLAKRLQRLFDGTIYIKSDNPAYERQEVSKQDTGQLEVIGRVVWTGRRM